jgi:hypothetical protein
LVKPESLRAILQGVSALSSLQQLQSLAVEMQDLHAPATSSNWRDQNRSNFPNNSYNREGGRRTLCKKCNTWHGEKERCRTNTPDRTRTDNKRFDQSGPRREWQKPRVTEAEMEQEDLDDTAVEEVDQ